MNSSEKEVLETAERLGIVLWPMEPPMRCIGMKGKCVAFIRAGQGPFDFVGIGPWGKLVAIEVKENRATKKRLPLIGKGKRGTGLQHHQLAALRAVYNANGIPLVLWKNGEEWFRFTAQDLNVGEDIKSLVPYWPASLGHHLIEVFRRE
jgi:hypothetical protein